MARLAPLALIAALLCIMALSALALPAKPQKNVKIDKLKDMRLMEKGDENGLIDFGGDDAVLNKYLLKGPRDYTVVASFTSSGQKYQCPPCAVWDSEFRKLAYTHYSMENRSQTMFFVSFDLGKMSQTTINYIAKHIHGIPYIAIFRPTATKASKWEVDRSDVYMAHSLEAPDVAAWINSKTDIHIRYPNYKRMVMIGSTIAIVSILGYLMYDTLWKWAHNPMLYFAACVVGYSIVCGGAVFSWIHQVPFMTVDRNGNGQWFASGGAREQLGAEALVMALVVGGGSMGWVLVGGLLPSLNRPRIVLLLAFCITICLMLLARVFFMWKHPYYPY